MRVLLVGVEMWEGRDGGEGGANLNWVDTTLADSGVGYGCVAMRCGVDLATSVRAALAKFGAVVGDVELGVRQMGRSQYPRVCGITLHPELLCVLGPKGAVFEEKTAGAAPPAASTRPGPGTVRA